MEGGQVTATTGRLPDWAHGHYLEAKARKIAREHRLDDGDEVYIQLNKVNIAQQMAEAAGPKEAPSILSQFQKFTKVFSEEEAKCFPPEREDDHAINFKEGTSTTLRCKLFPMHAEHRKAVKDWINDMVAKGFICESKSPMVVKSFPIKKKDGS